MFNMSKQNLSQLVRQISNTQQPLWHSGVNRMCTKIQHFPLNSNLDRYPINDILLRPIFNADEPKAQSDILAFNHPLGTGSSVHNINFCDNTNGSYTLRIDLSRHLEAIRRRHICISWERTQNDGSGVWSIPVCHGSGDLLDVVGLVRACHWDSSDTG